MPNPVKMILSSRQAGYSNRQQRQTRPKYKSDKCEVSSRYFVVGGQMAGCRHILTGLKSEIINSQVQHGSLQYRLSVLSLAEIGLISPAEFSLKNKVLEQR